MWLVHNVSAPWQRLGPGIGDGSLGGASSREITVCFFWCELQRRLRKEENMQGLAERV